METDVVARWMVIAGLVLALPGVLVFLLARVPFIGRLPGDISFRGDNAWIYVPLATSLLLSLILTIAINVIIRLR